MSFFNDLFVNGELEVKGNLKVDGVTTTTNTVTNINTENLNIKDQYIYLNGGATASQESGVVFNRGGTLLAGENTVKSVTADTVNNVYTINFENAATLTGAVTDSLIQLSGFSNANNNGIFVVKSVSTVDGSKHIIIKEAPDLTFAQKSLVASSAGADANAQVHLSSVHVLDTDDSSSNLFKIKSYSADTTATEDGYVVDTSSSQTLSSKTLSGCTIGDTTSSGMKYYLLADDETKVVASSDDVSYITVKHSGMEASRELNLKAASSVLTLGDTGLTLEDSEGKSTKYFTASRYVDGVKDVTFTSNAYSVLLTDPQVLVCKHTADAVLNLPDGSDGIKFLVYNGNAKASFKVSLTPASGDHIEGYAAGASLELGGSYKLTLQYFDGRWNII